MDERAEPSVPSTSRSDDVPFIRLNDVSKSFGAVKAVDHVTLDIKKGELFCLLGGSGSGKSTLLRMLAGFDEPTSGTIEIDGEPMAGIPAHQRPTNMMFQSYALFPHMNVERNVGYGLRRDGVAASEVADRVQEMLKLVQLEGYGRRKPNQLSGGQRQRVALARALVKRPKVLLLDEPLGALDKKLREETQFQLVNLQCDLGVTFIVVTHDQEEAMTLADRMGVMNDGRIEQIGAPRDVYELPLNRFVADFIGTVNMFETRVAAVSDSEVALSCDEAQSTFSIDPTVACSVDQHVWYAVRPEKVEMSREKPSSNNVLSGVVEDIAYLGNQSIYRVRIDSGKMVQVTKANRERGGEAPITWDEPVFLSFGPASGVVLAS